MELLCIIQGECKEGYCTSKVELKRAYKNISNFVKELDQKNRNLSLLFSPCFSSLNEDENNEV